MLTEQAAQEIVAEAVASGKPNPYYEVALGRCSRWDYYYLRWACVGAFGFAIPAPNVIAELAQRYPRIVELGPGTGYWAKMLSDAGADVVAYDNGAWEDRWIRKWFPIQQGDPRDLAKHADRALFMCWPDYNSTQAEDALVHYQGNDLIYIGEGSGGCTANDAFHDELNKEWTYLGMLAIPQWDGIHDRVQLYKRGKDD